MARAYLAHSDDVDDLVSRPRNDWYQSTSTMTNDDFIQAFKRDKVVLSTENAALRHQVKQLNDEPEKCKTLCALGVCDRTTVLLLLKPLLPVKKNGKRCIISLFCIGRLGVIRSELGKPARL